MRTIGIIGAMDEEIENLKQKLEIVTAKEMIGLQFFVGRMFSNSVVLVKSGIGKVNAAICAQILIDHFAVDCIVNVGVAGGLVNELKIGDIVISTDTVQHDMETDEPIGVIPRMEISNFNADEELICLAEEAAKEISGNNTIMKGRIASGDQFVCSQEQKNRIRSNVKGVCVEMEGAAIAQACYLNKIPFVIVRSISDNADSNVETDYYTFLKMAASRSSALVEKMLESIQ